MYKFEQDEAQVRYELEHMEKQTGFLQQQQAEYRAKIGELTVMKNSLESQNSILHSETEIFKCN